MNESVKEHISLALKKGVRLDGRKLAEFRPITIKRGVSATADGSAEVIAGETDLIVGIKFEVGTPYPDKPDAGTLMVNAELRPISNPEYEAGPPSIESIEVARVVDRTLRESKAIDEKGLCITTGEKVWMVNVDLCPLSADGNLIDLGVLAALAALQDARFPVLKEDGQPDYYRKSEERLLLKELPIAVTIVKIGENLLLDPTEDEMVAADSRLTIACLDDGRICALQKGGDKPITMEDLERMLDLALSTAKELRKLVVR